LSLNLESWILLNHILNRITFCTTLAHKRTQGAGSSETYELSTSAVPIFSNPWLHSLTLPCFLHTLTSFDSEAGVIYLASLRPKNPLQVNFDPEADMLRQHSNLADLLHIVTWGWFVMNRLMAIKWISL